MGWGVCFGLDDNNILYCADGCKWRARKSDMPAKPSGCEYVLEYFERTLHSELDMIRDECPGTAAALHEACHENIGDATRAYERLSDEHKAELSKTSLAKVEDEIKSLEPRLKQEKDNYNRCKQNFMAYKPSMKNPKYRMDELIMQMQPIKLELDMEMSADKVEKMTKRFKYLKRSHKLESLNM